MVVTGEIVTTNDLHTLKSNVNDCAIYYLCFTRKYFLYVILFWSYCQRNSVKFVFVCFCFWTNLTMLYNSVPSTTAWHRNSNKLKLQRLYQCWQHCWVFELSNKSSCFRNFKYRLCLHKVRQNINMIYTILTIYQGRRTGANPMSKLNK